MNQIAQGGATGTVVTGPISAPSTFYLQNQGSQQTAAVLFVQATPPRPSPAATLTVSPNVDLVEQGQYPTPTVTWNAQGYTQVAIHIVSPTGTIVATGGPSGSSAVYPGFPVPNPLVFYLVDVSSANTLASATFRLLTPGRFTNSQRGTLSVVH